MEEKKLTIRQKLVEYLFDNRKLDANYSIARTLLTKIKSIQSITIEEVAYSSHTSTGSVSRFCKKLGYDSFNELKTDQEHFPYANIFHDMIKISSSRGIDSALNFFAEENKKRTIELFQYFDHEQIKRVAERLCTLKSGAMLSGIHGFSPMNFFQELSFFNGITIYEINRSADISLIESTLTTESIVFIMSLSGQWMDHFLEKVNITSELAQKIILITYQQGSKYQSVCSEVISMEHVPEFFSSQYFSYTTLSMLFMVINLYVNAYSNL